VAEGRVIQTAGPRLGDPWYKTILIMSPHFLIALLGAIFTRGIYIVAYKSLSHQNVSILPPCLGTCSVHLNLDWVTIEVNVWQPRKLAKFRAVWCRLSRIHCARREFTYTYLSWRFIVKAYVSCTFLGRRESTPSHVPKLVETNHEINITILWSQQVQTDRTIPNNKPDIIIRDNENGTCILIDVAI
jgi:hypothetical protein